MAKIAQWIFKPHTPVGAVAKNALIALAFCLCANGLWAQGFRCPPVRTPVGGRFLLELADPSLRLFSPKNWAAPTVQSCVVLPRWSAAELPLFCKIEHQIGRRLPMPFKFRLGSVEYVDWLEGKGRQL